MSWLLIFSNKTNSLQFILFQVVTCILLTQNELFRTLCLRMEVGNKQYRKGLRVRRQGYLYCVINVESSSLLGNRIASLGR